MQINWQVFGHEKAKNILEKQISIGQIPQAYFFVGPAGVGKKTLALEFAEKILKTRQLSTCPDFQLLDSPSEITVEQILDFCSRMAFKPIAGGNKVFVINDAQNMNSQAQNALLKTLEEPSAGSVIILIAVAVLLPTVMSRCQKINFGSFNLAELKAFSQTLGQNTSAEVLELSFGRPGRLIKLVQQPEFLEQQKLSLLDYKNLLASGFGARLAALGRFAERDSQVLEDNFKGWLFWQLSRLKSHPQEFYRATALWEAIGGLTANLNKKLVLQGLFAKI